MEQIFPNLIVREKHRFTNYRRESCSSPANELFCVDRQVYPEFLIAILYLPKKLPIYNHSTQKSG